MIRAAVALCCGGSSRRRRLAHSRREDGVFTQSRKHFLIVRFPNARGLIFFRKHTVDTFFHAVSPLQTTVVGCVHALSYATRTNHVHRIHRTELVADGWWKFWFCCTAPVHHFSSACQRLPLSLQANRAATNRDQQQQNWSRTHFHGGTSNRGKLMKARPQPRREGNNTHIHWSVMKSKTFTWKIERAVCQARAKAPTPTLINLIS